jgi:hypothetical protein
VREGHRLMLLGAASDGTEPSAMMRLAYQFDDGVRAVRFSSRSAASNAPFSGHS